MAGCLFLARFRGEGLEGKVNANKYTAILSDHLQPMVNHSYPDGSGLFQDDNAAIHQARVVTEWFDEHANDLNPMPWPSQSPDLNPIEHLWEILEWHLRQRFPPPSTKYQKITFLMEEWCCISPIEFQTIVEYIPRCIEAVLARGGPTPY